VPLGHIGRSDRDGMGQPWVFTAICRLMSETFHGPRLGSPPNTLQQEMYLIELNSIEQTSDREQVLSNLLDSIAISIGPSATLLDPSLGPQREIGCDRVGAVHQPDCGQYLEQTDQAIPKIPT
jgi:hypothetical protein